MDMNLSKLWEMVRDREAWRAAVHEITKSETQLGNWTATMLPKPNQTKPNKQQNFVLELIKIAACKTNIYKSIIFLHSDHEQVETEIISTIPFIISPKKMKCFDINLTKLIQHLYAKNCRVLMKEMKRDLGKRGDIPCSWTEGSTVIEIAVIPIFIFRFNTIPIKIQVKLILIFT